MLRNYLKICFRNLVKDKLHAAINLFGLTIGITVFLIIFQYVSFERNYDNFHKEPEDIYRISAKRYAHNELIADAATAVPPLRGVIEAGLPKVNSVARIYFDGSSIVEYANSDGKKIFNESKAYYADETFFEIFGFPLLQGSANDVLDAPRKVVISSATASKYFGTENPIGKVLRITSQASTDYLVTGVFQNAPENSHFKPDILLSFRTYLEVIRPEWGVEQNWIWNDFYTYVKAPNTNSDELTTQVNRLAHDTWGKQYIERQVDFDFYAQPIQSIHTESHLEKEFEVNASGAVLSWLGYISIIILIIGWVNYFNLSMAKCVERAREVGVRKTFGASKYDVKLQFWMEAFLLNAFSLILSVCFFILLQKVCQTYLNIYYPAIFTTRLIIAMVVLMLGGLFFSTYPGTFLSNIGLNDLVQGKLKTKPRGKLLVNGLIVFQMIATPMLIAGAYLIQQQTKHLVNQELGVNTDQVLAVDGPRVISNNGTSIYDRFKHELEQIPFVNKSSAIMMLPGESINWYSSFKLYGDSTAEQAMNINLVEYDFQEVLDIELVAGRTFDHAFNDSTGLIINESAARLWGYEPRDIVGKTFWWRYSPDYHHFDKTVIGVIKDYQQHPGSKVKEPIIFSLRRYTPSDFAGTQFIMKLQGSSASLSSTIDQIENIWEDTYPSDPFNYEFMDETFKRIFDKEQQMLGLIKVFGLLSLVLAGLGLFGLSSLVTVQKTKEIGIRKVLGANNSVLLQLLSRGFLRISILAYLIAVPLMVIAAENWLANYEIRIELDAYFFILPLLTTFIVVMISTLSNSLLVINKNIVEALRYE